MTELILIILFLISCLTNIFMLMALRYRGKKWKELLKAEQAHNSEIKEWLESFAHTISHDDLIKKRFYTVDNHGVLKMKNKDDYFNLVNKKLGGLDKEH